MDCSRCRGNNKTVTVYAVRPGGHSLPSLPETFPVATTEHVCGQCLTDSELSRFLHPVAEFVLSTIINESTHVSAATIVALETVRAIFRVRNNFPEQSNRHAALKALGLFGHD
jgi:hypothetical protein